RHLGARGRAVREEYWSVRGPSDPAADDGIYILENMNTEEMVKDKAWEIALHAGAVAHDRRRPRDHQPNRDQIAFGRPRPQDRPEARAHDPAVSRCYGRIWSSNSGTTRLPQHDSRWHSRCADRRRGSAAGKGLHGRHSDSELSHLPRSS